MPGFGETGRPAGICQDVEKTGPGLALVCTRFENFAHHINHVSAGLDFLFLQRNEDRAAGSNTGQQVVVASIEIELHIKQDRLAVADNTNFFHTGISRYAACTHQHIDQVKRLAIGKTARAVDFTEDLHRHRVVRGISGIGNIGRIKVYLDITDHRRGWNKKGIQRVHLRQQCGVTVIEIALVIKDDSLVVAA